MKTAMTIIFPRNSARRWLARLCAALALLGCAAAHAQSNPVMCEVISPASVWNLDFGSYDIATSGGVHTVASPGTLQIRCNNSSPQGQRIKVCVELGDGTGGADGTMRRLISAVGSLNYQIYRDVAYSQVFGTISSNQAAESVHTIAATTSQIFDTQIRTYGRLPVVSGMVQAGVYGSEFPDGHVRIRYAASATTVPTCAQTNQLMPLNGAFGVRVTVPTACIVQVDQHVTFAAQTSLATPVDAIGRMRSYCNKDYQISIGDGLNAQGSNRHMRHSSNAELIHYELYQDASLTQRWGSTPAERWSSPAHSGQVHIVYARAFGNQTPSAGEYKDTVVVTVHY